MLRKTKYSQSLIYPLFIGVCLLLSSVVAKAMTIEDLGVKIKSEKILHITGPIMPGDDYERMLFEAAMTTDIEADRVVLIDSPGGSVDLGQRLIDSLLEEKRRHPGSKLICVVNGVAHSMAFNILSNCDERYALAKAKMIFHKIRVQIPPWIMLTAKELRAQAAALDAADAPYKAKNRKELHMTPAEYDAAADVDRSWSAQELMDRGFIKRIVTLR